MLFKLGPVTLVFPWQDFRTKMRGIYGHSEARPLADTNTTPSVPWPLASQVSIYISPGTRGRDQGHGWTADNCSGARWHCLVALLCPPTCAHHLRGTLRGVRWSGVGGELWHPRWVWLYFTRATGRFRTSQMLGIRHLHRKSSAQGRHALHQPKANNVRETGSACKEDVARAGMAPASQ